MRYMPCLFRFIRLLPYYAAAIFAVYYAPPVSCLLTFSPPLRATLCRRHTPPLCWPPRFLYRFDVVRHAMIYAMFSLSIFVEPRRHAVDAIDEPAMIATPRLLPRVFRSLFCRPRLMPCHFSLYNTITRHYAYGMNAAMRHLLPPATFSTI